MTNNPIFSKKDKIILCTLFAALWIYLWLKSILAPMSHDEVATFFYYIQNRSFLPFFTQADANNHILNSALTSFTYTIFGSSPIALRLPSLLAFIPYFYFIVRLASLLTTKIIRWTFIITLVCSFGMIEFFALSRGYGMSMALILASIWYLINVLQTNKPTHYILCLFFALLALLANLTLLVSFLIIFVWLIMMHLMRYKSGIKTNLILILSYLFLALIPLLLFLKYLILLHTTGALYYGSLAGFWQLSVRSISFMLTGITSEIIPYVFLILSIITIIFFILILIKDKIKHLLTDTSIIFFILLSLNLSAIFLMAKLLKVNYPEDRVGLYLFPFFIGSLCFLMDKIITIYNRKWLLLILLPLLFFPINLIYSANFSRCNIYLQDRFPKRFFDKVVNNHKPGEFPPSVGGNSVKLFCWTFFNYRNNGSEGPIHFWNNPSTDEEFQIVMPDEISYWNTKYDSIDYDKYSGLLLLKRRNPYQKLLLKDYKLANAIDNPNEFLNLIEINADSLIGKTLFIGYKLNITTLKAPFNAHIVIDVSDKKNNNLNYEYISLNWLKLHYTGNDINFLNGMLIHRLPPEASKIKTYIWNLSKVPFSVKGDVLLYECRD